MARGSIALMSEADFITLEPVDRPVDQTVRLPGSKSLTNRALLLAALSDGISEIDGVLLADDTELMSAALAKLGAAVRLDRCEKRAVVRGRGGHWPADEADLFCGNAGTTMRFLTAACCLGYGSYRLDGVPRMRARPLGGLIAALRDLGADIRCEDDEGRCPLVVHAKGLRGGTARFRGPESSQFVSALLMAAPRASGDVLIDVEGTLPSEPFVRMTLSVMDCFGAVAATDRMAKFVVPGGQTYRACRYEVEPDATAASYFFAAAALTGGRVTVQGLGTSSCQGDWAFVDVLERLGCRVDRRPDSTTVWGPSLGNLRGLDVDLNAMPDVAQTLAVLAAFAEGPTTIRGLGSLRVKETDRLAALAAELGRMRVETDAWEDGITIRPQRPPVAARIETYNDHRMAMSFALAGLRVEGIQIANPGCVSKTFPGFFEAWERLRSVTRST